MGTLIFHYFYVVIDVFCVCYCTALDAYSINIKTAEQRITIQESSQVKYSFI